jgi:hypothetical protein
MNLVRDHMSQFKNIHIANNSFFFESLAGSAIKKLLFAVFGEAGFF